MEYVRIKTPDAVVNQVASTLSLHLRSGEKVAWFLSGGSAVDIEVSIAQALQTHDVSRLYIGLVDERYGPVGHKDENYVRLMDAHFPIFINRVLTGDSGEKTARAFGTQIENALKNADFSLGIFGIGPDGHTAGIKPHSPAVASSEPTIFYKWDDYQRITITPATIRKIDEIVVYARGGEKAASLHTLLHSDTPIADQPAQILKGTKDCTLYTDQKLQRIK